MNEAEQTDKTVGRPSLSSDEDTVVLNVTIPASYKKFLESLGRNTSATVRALIEAEMAREDEA